MKKCDARARCDGGWLMAEVGGVNESCDASEAERSFVAELCRMAENGNQD